MMPHTNTDLLKHLPETHRPLTEHERLAIAAKRAVRTKTWKAFRRLLGGLERPTDNSASPAKGS